MIVTLMPKTSMSEKSVEKTRKHVFSFNFEGLLKFVQFWIQIQVHLIQGHLLTPLGAHRGRKGIFNSFSKIIFE